MTMSLRLKANLFFALLIMVFVATMMGREIVNTRSSVWEEIEAANRVATQILGEVAVIYRHSNDKEVVNFLKQLGRVRANEVEYRDQQQNLIYQSPPSPYKKDRFAPEFYADLIMPMVTTKKIVLDAGVITITPDPSRAILDGWDELHELLIAGLLALLITNIIGFFFIGRWLKPFEAIREALQALEKGNHDIRLENLHGKEASLIGHAFNQMVGSVNETIVAKAEKAKTEAMLSSQKQFAHQLQTHIENERKDLARELHDELGQSLTAIRAIASSIDKQSKDNPQLQQSTQLMLQAAGETYDGMLRLIPKLRPIAIDQLGLEGALLDMFERLKTTNSNIEFNLKIECSQQVEEINLAFYRIIQEAVNNAIKHANPSKIAVNLSETNNFIELSIKNDGQSPVQLSNAGHFGIEGMQERAHFVGGDLSFNTPDTGGLVVQLKISKS
jgi:two-component system sensor histidine kinase UhpB